MEPATVVVVALAALVAAVVVARARRGRRGDSAYLGSIDPSREPAASNEGESDPFPIKDYDRLDASNILALLPELYDDELDLVARRELAGQRRSLILDRIARLR